MKVSTSKSKKKPIVLTKKKLQVNKLLLDKKAVVECKVSLKKKTQKKVVGYPLTREQIAKIISVIGLGGLLYYFGENIRKGDFKKDIFGKISPLKADTKGHRMLTQKGWVPGTPLRPRSQREPIEVSGQTDRYGIGYTTEKQMSKKPTHLRDFIKSTK